MYIIIQKKMLHVVVFSKYIQALCFSFMYVKSCPCFKNTPEHVMPNPTRSIPLMLYPVSSRLLLYPAVHRHKGKIVNFVKVWPLMPHGQSAINILLRLGPTQCGDSQLSLSKKAWTRSVSQPEVKSTCLSSIVSGLLCLPSCR